MDTPAYIAERMQAEGQKTLEFFRRLEPEEWDAMIYTEGSDWLARDVLAHFVAAEDGVTRLVESILAGGHGVPVDFDLNSYNERKVVGLNQVSVEDLLVRFAALRQKSAGLAKGLSQDDLAITGRHPWLGETTIAEILKMMYRHNQIHQRDIRRTLASGERGQDG
jgi:hypothetical protein